MGRIKLNKAYFRRKGNYVDGRKRYVLEKEIAGKVYSIALNTEKLWKLLIERRDSKKTEGFTEETTSQ